MKWTKRELDEINRKTRKVMAMTQELHFRSDVDKLSVSRMEGGKGLTKLKRV